MFMLLGGNEKKVKKEAAGENNMKEARDLFNMGRFPVVTTQVIENRPIAKVLGLVCCRGFDSEEAFFGMTAMAVKKGAQGIIGYNENIAFHPDGSKYFSCFGTAVMFQRDGRSDLLTNKKIIKDTLSMIPNAPAPVQSYAPDISSIDEEEKLTLQGVNKPNTIANAPINTIANAPINTIANAPISTFGSAFRPEEMRSNSAQIAAQLAAEDGINSADKRAMQAEIGRIAQQPSEEEDPVLQRLLASQKREAPQNWQ